MSPRRPLPIAARSLVLIAAVLTLLTLGAARADAPDAPAAPSVTGTTAAAPIPPAELGARADAQQPAPPPVLAAGQATLSAPLQALRGALDPAGLTVDSTSASEGEGQFRLTPTHLDKGATPLALPPGTVQLRGSAAVLERGPVTEILTASGDGLRQDFVVAQAPPGNGPLTLTLALDGATAAADPAGVALTLPGGRRLVYHRLHITDAAGQVLAGTLAAADAHTLTIRVADAAAHYPLTIDPTISDADWQVWNPGLPGANGTVNAMAYDSTGSRLYVGGSFTAIGTVLANRIAQWDGSAWSALGSGLNNQVYALAVSGTGLYVGGVFTSASGSPVNRIARWDGSTWSALGSGLNNTVNALAVSGTDLYVGGWFTTAGSSPASRIARWNGSTWSALGSGLSSAVNALAVSGTDLYVGGAFSTAGGSAANHIAQWNGSTWSALGSGLNNTVYALAVSGPDLYVGGWFTTAGGSAANNIAKWNGSAWSALGSGLDGTVTALAVSGTDLYVGGSFTTAGGSAANRIAQWNGSTWSALGSGLNDWVNALAVSGTDLYVGGHFLTAGGQFSPYAAYVHLPPCGSGLAYPTGQWQQFALPCTPSASPASIANVLGTSPTANLPLATYAGQWMLYGRNGTNSGNVALASNATLAPDAGYWFKSLTAPVDGKLQVIEGRTTPVESGVTGCQSVNGCAVIPVAGATAGARLIGNPFAYHVDWSKVRVRVNGIDLYTPSQAFAANLLSKQIWIWNGASYDTWDDASDPGNLQYFKSFFIKVLPGGVGKTIELLIPALPSGVPLSARPSGVAERLAAALRDWLIPGAAAAEPAAGWQVRLRVTNPATGAKTRALLGQRPAAEPGYDPADLSALAPFASPYLTLVIPQPGWGTNKGDYAADFRPADGVPDQWNLELRSNPAGAAVMLRWEGDPAVLARSRLTDRQTGRSSIPATRPLPTATRSPSPPRCGR